MTSFLKEMTVSQKFCLHKFLALLIIYFWAAVNDSMNVRTRQCCGFYLITVSVRGGNNVRSFRYHAKRRCGLNGRLDGSVKEVSRGLKGCDEVLMHAHCLIVLLYERNHKEHRSILYSH